MQFLGRYNRPLEEAELQTVTPRHRYSGKTVLPPEERFVSFACAGS